MKEKLPEIILLEIVVNVLQDFLSNKQDNGHFNIRKLMSL